MRPRTLKSGQIAGRLCPEVWIRGRNGCVRGLPAGVNKVLKPHPTRSDAVLNAVGENRTVHVRRAVVLDVGMQRIVPRREASEGEGSDQAPKRLIVHEDFNRFQIEALGRVDADLEERAGRIVLIGDKAVRAGRGVLP